MQKKMIDLLSFLKMRMLYVLQKKILIWTSVHNVLESSSILIHYFKWVLFLFTDSCSVVWQDVCT